MKSIKIKVYGRVQGVFFRAGTKNFCDKNGLKGYVKNVDDGGVEIVACGSEEQLEKLVEWLKSSPGASKVERVIVKETRPPAQQGKNEFESFEIIRDGNFFRDKGKAIGNLLEKSL